MGAILALGLILLAAWAWRTLRGSGTAGKRRIGEGLHHLQEQMARYRCMTPQMLAEVPEDALLEAVLANLWAKMAPGLADAQAVMGQLSSPRQRFYAVYSVYGHIHEKGLGTLPAGWEDAALCLEQIGAQNTAALLRRAAAQPNERALMQAPFEESFAAEQAKQRLGRYIREHADAFCDPPEDA